MSIGKSGCVKRCDEKFPALLRMTYLIAHYFCILYILYILKRIFFYLEILPNISQLFTCFTSIMKKYIAHHDEPWVVTNDYYRRYYVKTVIIITYDCIVIYYYHWVILNDKPLRYRHVFFSKYVDEKLDITFVQLI